MKQVSLDKFCSDLELEVLHRGNFQFIDVINSSINRPGLQIYGFYEHFDSDRVQIIGKVEMSYLRHLPKEEMEKKIDKFFSQSFPCLIIAWDLDVCDYFIQSAKNNNKILLRTKLQTTKIIFKMINYCEEILAPVIAIHGVLVEVFGVGVLITGSSGVGKSETALELVKRGHRLISDDVVQIKRIGDRRLVGTAPELLKHFMEIRGVGIIDVRNLYGIGAVKESVELDMAIKLEKWENGKYYDRLGLDNQIMDILGVNIPEVTIPVTTGRNLAIIIETAAKNNREKVMGHNSAKEFCEKIYNVTSKK